MWLHMIFNEKFAPVLVEMFEEAQPQQHIYAMFSPPKQVNMPVDYHLIKTKLNFIKLLRSRSDWQGIIFNPCDPICWHWLFCIPKELKVVWYGWGYEYYAYWKPLIKHCHYLPTTNKWVKRNKPLHNQLMEAGLRLYATLGHRQLQRVDYFISPLREDYNLIIENGFLPSSVEHRFGRVGKISKYRGNSTSLGQDILLGNSADPTNNHMEAIDRLSTVDLAERKIITPLSYGNPDYREMINRYGKEKLGDRFEPITEFMPLAEYQKLLSRCGIVIMNHLRQQALGNLIPSIMNGAKIFLNDTPLYKGFKNKGIHVFNFNTDFEFEIYNRLSDSQARHNREIMEQWQGDDRVISELRAMLTKTDSEQ